MYEIHQHGHFGKSIKLIRTIMVKLLFFTINNQFSLIKIINPLS